MKVTDFFPNYPLDKVADFETRKNKIRLSNMPGCIRLLRDFDGVTEQKGFLNRICELNVANRLLERGKAFEYETKGEDFAYDNILLSVKSLQPKGYEEKERERIIELQAEALRSGHPQKDTLPLYKTEYSASSVDIEVTEGGYSRSETATVVNAIIPTDAYEEAVICKYAAKFEPVEADGRKKVILFMGQSERIGPFHVEDVANWYFGLSDLNNTDSSFYEKSFKTNDGKLMERNGSIKAFIFMRHTDPILWSNDMGQATVHVWSQDADLVRSLRQIFES